MTSPRAYTQEEIKEQFLKHIAGLVDYWENVPRDTTREKLSGLAFSILSVLDGCAMSFPKFVVASDPCPTDKEFHQDRGKNWYPNILDEICDISGNLHEEFYTYFKEEVATND